MVRSVLVVVIVGLALPASAQPERRPGSGSSKIVSKTKEGRRTCSPGMTGKYAPISAVSHNWTVVASSSRTLTAVDEHNNACVGGGISRGILALAGPGGVDGLTSEQVHDIVMDELKNDPVTQWSPGTQNSDGKWSGGGSYGDLGDFKRVKDKVTTRLYNEGRIPKIETSTVNRGDMDHQTFIKYIKGQLDDGHVVEVDIDGGNGTGHFANVTQVVRDNITGDLGIIIEDDPKQADQTPEVGQRNAYFFTGDLCYFYTRSKDPPSDTGKKKVRTRKIRGIMVERTTRPKKKK